MKKCPLCNRTFDDSWKVCLYDNKRLTQIAEEESPSPQQFNWDDFPEAKKMAESLVEKIMSQLELSGKRRLRNTFLVTMFVFGLLALFFRNIILLIIGVVIFVFIIGYILSRSRHE